MWSSRVDEPFRSNERFWRSVAASLGALLALVVATVITGVIGGPAVVAFLAPAVLLVLAGREARLSSAVTRPQFASREEWRDAERRAVAAALWPHR